MSVEESVTVGCGPDRLTVSAGPLPPDTFPTESGLPPAAIVFITAAAGSTSIEAGQLAYLYSLTPAEARLASALVAGQDLMMYAGENGTSYHTARKQLRSIFEKTGHARQSDLIRDILSNPFMRLIGRG